MTWCDLNDCMSDAAREIDFSDPVVVIIAIVLAIWVLRQLEKD